MIVSLSSRQYVQLRELDRKYPDGLTVEDAALYNQTTFGSFLRRKYLAWKGQRFKLTKEAKEALQQYREVEIYRIAVSNPLTCYFVGPWQTPKQPKKHLHLVHRKAS